MVITSVLDEYPPCVGVGRAVRELPPVWFLASKFGLTLLFGVHEACITGIMAQGGLYKQETILRSGSGRLLA